MNKNIFLVNLSTDLFESNFNKFKDSDIINIFKIKEKLLKNNEEDDDTFYDDIFEFEIVKNINKFKKSEKSFLYILLNESYITSNFINNIKQVFDNNIKVNILINNEESLNLKNIKYFDNILIFNDGK